MRNLFPRLVSTGDEFKFNFYSNYFLEQYYKEDKLILVLYNV